MGEEIRESETKKVTKKCEANNKVVDDLEK